MKTVMLLAGLLVPANSVAGGGYAVALHRSPSAHGSADARSQTATSAQQTPADLDPALAGMMALTGGTWVTRQGKFVAEFHYERVMNGRAIRGTGVLGKGSSGTMDVLTMFG